MFNIVLVEPEILSSFSAPCRFGDRSHADILSAKGQTFPQKYYRISKYFSMSPEGLSLGQHCVARRPVPKTTLLYFQYVI